MINRAILIVLLSCFTLPALAQPVVMGYWENWGTYQNFPMPNNAEGSTNPILSSQITGINALAYAFLEVTDNGSLQFSDPWSDLDPNSPQDKSFCSASPVSCQSFPQANSLGNFTAFSKTKVSHHVVSVGGAGHDAAWEKAFRYPDQFVSSLKALQDTYKIDWLDIDYEPVGGVPAQNIQGFIELTNKIKQAMPAMILSYAIPANSDSIKNFGQANWEKLAKNLNYVSIMGYDIHGVFDVSNPITALQSALIADDNGYSIQSAQQALNSVGITNDKIILGMPMYGRALGGVDMNGLGQKFTSGVKGDLDDNNCSTNLQAGNVCAGMIQYKTLVDQAYTAIPVTTKNQLVGVYAYNASQRIFVSYDNASSAAAKAQYAVNQKLGGVMFWALRFDKPVNDPQSILGAVDKVYGIQSSASSDPIRMKLELTNNDPNNAVTISLVTADKSKYYPFPALAPKSGIAYTDATSSIVKTLLGYNNLLVLLTSPSGTQVMCPGNLNLAKGAYRHIQVYFDSPVPSCAIS